MASPEGECVMPFVDAKYPPPRTPPAMRRIGVVVEQRVGGCMCKPLSVYTNKEFGEPEFNDLTVGVPINGTSWDWNIDGECGCGKAVVYNQWLLVTGGEPA